MSEVHSLHGGAIPQAGKPSEHVVRILEDRLARARAGEIVSVAVVTTKPNGDVSTEWHADANYRHDMIAGIAMLEHRVLRQVFGDGA